MIGLLRCAVPGLALLAMACTRFATVGTDIIGPGYVTGGGEWNSGGGITIVVSVLSVNQNRDVMEAGSVYIGRTRIVHNLAFMARIPYSDNITGSQANCVASAVPWRKEFAETGPRTRIPRMAFGAEGGDEDSGGGGDILRFRETERPDIIR
jgi:hypothetical protein